MPLAWRLCDEYRVRRGRVGWAAAARAGLLL